MTLDKLVLDELVQGHDSDSETWKSLLKDSNREDIWCDAVKRREQLDRFCLFAVKWPSLAQVYKEIKPLIKESMGSPKLKLSEFIYPNLSLEATLSKEDISKISSDSVVIDILWGEHKIIELDGVKRLKFSIETKLPIYYSYSGGTGWITTKDFWDFQPSEGAVLLTFIDGPKDERDDLSSTTSQARSISIIILLPK